MEPTKIYKSTNNIKEHKEPYSNLSHKQEKKKNKVPVTSLKHQSQHESLWYLEWLI